VFTVEVLLRLDRPCRLWQGAGTIPRGVSPAEILHELWSHAQYTETMHAGHMALITHADVVHSIIEAFIVQASQRICVRRPVVPSMPTNITLP
jgi:pimeloyl-ACP methyl ester carboxylesterase